jgi:hypothetical protein
MPEAVISCPKCARQYAVDSTLAGKSAQCRACKCTFNISLATPTYSEPEIMLADEIIVHVNFLREACAEMALNSSDLLRLAGERVTEDSVRKIVESLLTPRGDRREDRWRNGYLNKTMEKAFSRVHGSPEMARLKEIVDYFVSYIPTRNPVAFEALQSAFCGMLTIKFDRPEPEIPEPQPEPEEPASLSRWLRWAVGL